MTLGDNFCYDLALSELLLKFYFYLIQTFCINTIRIAQLNCFDFDY